jgi:hypothetical protein
MQQEGLLCGRTVHSAPPPVSSARGIENPSSFPQGLGKTIQTIAVLLHLKEGGQLTSPALLVVPTSLIR